METLIMQAIGQIGQFGLIAAGVLVSGVMFGLWWARTVNSAGYRGSQMSQAERAHVRKYGRTTTPARWF